MNIVNGSELSIDQLAPYMSDILREMGRMARKYPQDITTASLFQDVLSGKKTLWLVLDGEDLVAIAMSTVRTVDDTGCRIATLLNLVGKDVAKYAADLCLTLETWADQNECSVMAVEGRRGWEPLLAQFGYKPFSVLYRKVAVKA